MRLVLPPSLDADDLAVSAGELGVLRDDVDAWIGSTLREGIPKKSHVHVSRDEEHATKTGWPFRLVESELVGEDERLLEVRAHAFYSFLEHGAVVAARAPHAEGYAARREALLGWLRAVAPDFSGPVSALAQVFDLPEPGAEPPPAPEPEPEPGPAADAAAEVAPAGPARPTLEQIFRAAKAARGDFAQLAAALAHVDAHLADSPGPIEHFVRGGILVQLGQGLEAVDSYRQAVTLDPGFAEAHFALGLAYADLGRDADAVAAWDKAIEARPDFLDALYNKAQAHYTRGEHAQALEAWKRALEVAPADFFLLKKLAQTQHALGLHDEAEATHDTIASVWQKSTDATVRHISEYVFDQFEVGGRTVHAFETLRPPRPDFYSVFSFRVVDAKGQPTGLAVQLETSQAARARGTPFVLTLADGAAYRVMGTYDGRPGYPMLKEHAIRVLAEAMATPPRSS